MAPSEHLQQLTIKLDQAIQKLTKWRALYAGWWFGTKPIGDSGSKAARDNFDRTIIMRCELNALAKLAIEKGLFTQEEWTKQLLEEVQHMDLTLEALWPGFHTSAAGLEMNVLTAAQTMRERGFPP